MELQESPTNANAKGPKKTTTKFRYPLQGKTDAGLQSRLLHLLTLRLEQLWTVLLHEGQVGFGPGSLELKHVLYKKIEDLTSTQKEKSISEIGNKKQRTQIGKEPIWQSKETLRALPSGHRFLLGYTSCFLEMKFQLHQLL